MEMIAILVSTIGLVWLSTLAFQASQLRWYEKLLGRQQREETEQSQEQVLKHKTKHLYQEQYERQTTSTNWRYVKIAKIVEESEDCRSFLLVDPSGDRLAPFQPGQHLLVEHASCDAGLLRRCYSISIEPGTGYYRITVKRQAKGDASHSLSQRLHSSLKEGDILRVKGPQGRFTLQLANDQPIVLLAAGIGVTPMLSMASALLKGGDQRSIDFFYQVRDLHHAPLLGELVELAEAHRNFRLYTFLSQQPVIGRSTVPFFTGRFGRQALAQRVRATKPHFFLCGPNPWMDSKREEIESLGHDTSRIHWESFGGNAAGVIANEKVNGEAGTSRPSYPITLHPQQSLVQCLADTTLLESLEAQGVPIEAGCRSGNCGSCVAKLRSGRVRYTRQPGCGIQDGEVALCVAVPESPLELEI